MNRFWRHGLSKGTRKAYGRGVRRFSRWCSLRGIKGDSVAAKPKEIDLIFYVVHEARRGMSPGTIKSNLSAIVSSSVAHGFANPVRDKNLCPRPALRRVVRGISRLNSKARKTRKPLTTDKLAAVIKVARGVTGSAYNGACFKAALSVGVYLLLRVGELVSPKTTGHNPAKGLNVEDIKFLPSFEKPDRMEVKIKNSKGDPFRNGQVLVACANGSPTCPVALMKRWLEARGRKDKKGAVFKLSSGKLLTRDTLQKWLRAGLDAAGYKGEEHSCHSLRAGGAESLAAAGFDSSLIQVMGRWASDAFLLYLKVGNKVRQEASLAMSKLQRQDVETMNRRGRDVRELDSNSRF